MRGMMQESAAEAPAVEEQPNVSPEEQAEYQQFVANGHMAIYSDGSFERIVKSLSGNRPEQALANTAATVVKQLETSARKQGKQINPDVLMQGGREIFEELADLQSMAGIADLPQDKLEGAFYRALDTYRTMSEADGSLNKQAIEQDMTALMQADQQGRLGEVLPAIGQKGAM